MARRAFVFSLDAFVAFSLILISIQSLLVISSVPKGYYPALLQADYLAHDTMQVMTLAENRSGISYLDMDSQTIAKGGAPGNMVFITNHLIPYPYSFAYYFYNFSNQKWILLYNASNTDPSNIHYNITYHRVQASAQTLVLGYTSPIFTGASPYCNVVCKGWDRTHDQTLEGGNTPLPSHEACTKVPCDVKGNTSFDVGDFNVGILRLVVWG